MGTISFCGGWPDVTASGPGEGREIPGTVYLWAELKRAAKYEMAVRLG